MALPSGGTLVIDHTEALTVIDVNSGKYVGSSTLADTIFHVNKEAAVEIARQLRLRDIGGIVLVDFIDMTGAERREEVLRILQRETAADRARVHVLGMTALNLVEITRKSHAKDCSRPCLRPARFAAARAVWPRPNRYTSGSCDNCATWCGFTIYRGISLSVLTTTC